MSKKTFKLSELQCTIPDSGQYPEKETGKSGKEYKGLDPYNYDVLKGSLDELGYVPDQFDFICADENGKVMYGSRRVWLMQKDMEWAGDTDIEVEVMTLEELYKDLGDRILDKDAMPTVNADGTITPPKQTLCMPPNKDLSVLVDEHRNNPNIEGYDYDYVAADGTVVDAGKS